MKALVGAPATPACFGAALLRIVLGTGGSSGGSPTAPTSLLARLRPQALGRKGSRDNSQLKCRVRPAFTAPADGGTAAGLNQS